MKILLIGEYSNVHATLREGLRALGHQVTLISNGDFWKDYPRDIDLSRPEGCGSGITYVLRLCRLLPKMRGYDVVQIINPMFVELKAARIFPLYRYLRRHNTRVFLCAFGMDYYWVSQCCERMPLRYSDFNIGDKIRQDQTATTLRAEWMGTDKERLNRYIATHCDGIVAGLYEYWVCYHPLFPKATTYIPFPIVCRWRHTPVSPATLPVKVFIGINTTRSAYKGTDIMLRAAEDLQRQYPDRMRLTIAHSVPFSQYRKMLGEADILLDQLYSYTPSMNTLEAMSQGIVCVGGGEPEFYDFIHEPRLRPIVNVRPSYDDVRDKLEQLILHPDNIQRLKAESLTFVRKHHHYIDVARQYVQFWSKP